MQSGRQRSLLGAQVPRQRAFRADLAVINECLDGLIALAKRTRQADDAEALQARDYSKVGGAGGPQWFQIMRVSARTRAGFSPVNPAHYNHEGNNLLSPLYDVFSGTSVTACCWWACKR